MSYVALGEWCYKYSLRKITGSDVEKRPGMAFDEELFYVKQISCTKNMFVRPYFQLKSNRAMMFFKKKSA
jgi:hypothetical protein